MGSLLTDTLESDGFSLRCTHGQLLSSILEKQLHNSIDYPLESVWWQSGKEGPLRMHSIGRPWEHISELVNCTLPGFRMELGVLCISSWLWRFQERDTTPSLAWHIWLLYSSISFSKHKLWKCILTYVMQSLQNYEISQALKIPQTYHFQNRMLVMVSQYPDQKTLSTSAKWHQHPPKLK